MDRDLASAGSMLMSAQNPCTREGEQVTMPESPMSSGCGRGGLGSETCRAESSGLP